MRVVSVAAALTGDGSAPDPKPLNVAAIVAEFRRVAREHGYAIGEHGSKKRDYDLIACPWTKDAKACSTLIRALVSVDGVKLKFHTKSRDLLIEGCSDRKGPKPHGRLGYVFLFTGDIEDAWPPHYIDLSVMPRTRPA